MPKRKLLQIGNITSRMADRLEPEFDIIEYFKSENKEKTTKLLKKNMQAKYQIISMI